jgi:lycopene cyclase domain-containing protein
VRHLTYLAVLAFCLAAAVWLEFVVRTHVFRRWRRLLVTLLPVVVAFLLWDWYAVAHRQWTFDPTRTTGWLLPAGIPVEEFGFFVVVPLCTVLAYEAVRAVRGWDGGDETPGRTSGDEPAQSDPRE